MSLRAWMGRGSRLVQRGRQSKLFKSWYHHWSGSPKSHKGARSHLLLYGAVAFVWERERISNQDVVSCVREYADRVSGEVAVEQNRTPLQMSSSPPTPQCDHTPSASQISDHTPSASRASGAWLFNWMYTPPHPSSTPPSSADSAHSSSGSSGMLSWVGGGKSPSPVGDTPGASPSHEPSTWSNKITRWFAAGESELPADYETDIETDNARACSATAETLNDPDPLSDKKRRREEIMEHYRAHSNDHMSRLPLVGIAGMVSPMRQGMQALERVKDKTKSKIIRLLSKHQIYLAEELDCFAEHADEEGPYSPLADLACIGVDLETQWYRKTLTLHTGDWVGYYMQVERLDEAGGETTPPTTAVDVWEPYKEHAVLLEAGKALQSFVDNVKLLVLVGQEHFKDQLLVEEAFCIDEQQWTETLGEALLDARNTVRAVWSEVLQCYTYGSSLVSRQNGGTGRLGGMEGMKGSATGTAVMLSQQVPVAMAAAASGSSVTENTGKAGPVWNWELVTGDRNYTAYRKFYKDTGLFQYKVIGHYDDITAKGFFEAQVDHEFRKTWDEYAGDMVTMDRDPESNSRLIHWIMKYPFPMSNREYLFVQRSWVSDKNDTIVIFNRSTSHPDVPDTDKCVRVKDYFSRMVIRSPSRVDELGLDFELTYFDNPQTNLPSSCVNWVASTAMPDFMGKIHTAALTRQK